MRYVLNVAEKPSVAKSITEILSSGNCNRELTHSKTNPVYSFDTHIDGETCKMYFTSVRGYAPWKTNELKRVGRCMPHLSLQNALWRIRLSNCHLPPSYGGTNLVEESKELGSPKGNLIYLAYITYHLVSLDFEPLYRSWDRTPIQELFTAPTFSCVSSDSKDIERNILHYARLCYKIILWLDCDREGEAIAFEVLSVFQRVNKNPVVKRAVFSAVTSLFMSKTVFIFKGSDIEYACANLRLPNRNLAMAVETRQEIDLRIGSSMTRFMTLKYKPLIETKANVLSYGPCQLPTLGFIVERFDKIESFVKEPFWSISVEIHVYVKTATSAPLPSRDDISVPLLWDRIRLFDRLAVLSLYEICLQNPKALVTSIKNREVKKYPPLPLDTVEMNKAVSKFLKISSSQCMQLAESLYNKGYISYPRTETNTFPNSMDLLAIINCFSDHPDFRTYAHKLLNGLSPLLKRVCYLASTDLSRRQGGFCVPLMGNKNDESHPPIHPVKAMTRQDAETPSHWNFETAIADESNVFVDVAGEGFHTKGLIIREKNWLDIYTYEKWNGRIIPNLEEGHEYMPSNIVIKTGETTPPSLITESKLIDLMNKVCLHTEYARMKFVTSVICRALTCLRLLAGECVTTSSNGIGTDATMHEHIQKIQDRYYTVMNEDFTFVPTNLGRSIYNAFKKYTSSSVDLTKPILRAHMESDMNDIANGVKNKQDVVQRYSLLMKNIYLDIAQRPEHFDRVMNTLQHLSPDDAPLPTISSY